MKSSYRLIVYVVFAYMLSGCATANVVLLDPSHPYRPTKSVAIITAEPADSVEVSAIIEGVGYSGHN